VGVNVQHWSWDVSAAGRRAAGQNKPKPSVKSVQDHRRQVKR